MVAEHEDALDVATVRRLVVREDIEPSVRQRLQLAGEAAVRHVARDRHGVDAVVAEPRERRLKGLRVIRVAQLLATGGKAHVHVRERAE